MADSFNNDPFAQTSQNQSGFDSMMDESNTQAQPDTGVVADDTQVPSDANGGLDKFEQASGLTPEQVTEYLGQVDKDAIYGGKSVIHQICFGYVKDNEHSTPDKPVFVPNHNQIRLGFTFKDEFGSKTGVWVNSIRKFDEQKQDPQTGALVDDPTGKSRNERTNIMIKLGLHAYGFTDFDSIAQLAVESSEADKANPKLQQYYNTLKSKGVTEEQLLVPIYQHVGKNSQNGQSIRYYSFSRRKAGNSFYGKFYAKLNDFPTRATQNFYFNHEQIVQQMAMKGIPETEQLLRGKIVAINNNTRFNRFEVLIDPLDMTPQYAQQRKANPVEEHSTLVTYNYGKFMGKGQPTQLDREKRFRQSNRLCDALGVIRYSEVGSKIGSVVLYNVNRKDANPSIGQEKPAYYATIRRLDPTQNDKVQIWGSQAGMNMQQDGATMNGAPQQQTSQGQQFANGGQTQQPTGQQTNTNPVPQGTQQQSQGGQNDGFWNNNDPFNGNPF